MRKNNILKYVLVFLIIVIYLMANFFNILKFITKELNFDAISILVNAIVAEPAFLITYSLVNKKHLKKNKKLLIIKTYC